MHSARAKVNQQVAWCQLLISQCESLELPWQQQALAQSLVWHLQAAYVSFLQELAADLRFTVTKLESAQDLLNAVPEGRAAPQEILELGRLEQGESWLSALRGQLSPMQTEVTSEPAEGNKVELIAVSGCGRLDLPGARGVLSCMIELIERNRSLSAES